MSYDASENLLLRRRPRVVLRSEPRPTRVEGGAVVVYLVFRHNLQWVHTGIVV